MNDEIVARMSISNKHECEMYVLVSKQKCARIAEYIYNGRYLCRIHKTGCLYKNRTHREILLNLERSD